MFLGQLASSLWVYYCTKNKVTQISLVPSKDYWGQSHPDILGPLKGLLRTESPRYPWPPQRTTEDRVTQISLVPSKDHWGQSHPDIPGPLKGPLRTKSPRYPWSPQRTTEDKVTQISLVPSKDYRGQSHSDIPGPLKGLPRTKSLRYPWSPQRTTQDKVTQISLVPSKDYWGQSHSDSLLWSSLVKWTLWRIFQIMLWLDKAIPASVVHALSFQCFGEKIVEEVLLIAPATLV